MHNHLLHFDPHEQLNLLRALAKWLVLGSCIGALAGTASALFLFSLDWAQQTRLTYPWLLYLLPLAGFLIGYAYHTVGGEARRGSHLVIEQINASSQPIPPNQPIPLRMAPMVLFGTVITHLVGGSAGREGTAVQMGSTLADWLYRSFRLEADERPFLMMAGVSAGFSSVFSTPLAGFVFGLEVQRVGRVRYDGVLPCLVASLAAELVARAWGVKHAHYPQLGVQALELILIGKVVVAGLGFGLAALLFIELHHAAKRAMQWLVDWPPLRPVLGGFVIILLTWLVGNDDYLSLGLPLIDHSLDGTGVPTLAFLGKILFTVVTLGSGFVGGEVTPLFAIGSSLGYTLGWLLAVDPGWMAALGFVAVFAGASNTPMACLLMGIELFGSGSSIYLLLACFVAYLACGHRGIYSTQVIEALKMKSRVAYVGVTVEEVGGSKARSV